MGVEERGIRTREVATKGKTSVRWEAREAQRGNLLPAVFAGFEFPHMAHLLCTRQRRLSTSLFHSSRLSSSASLLCFALTQTVSCYSSVLYGQSKASCAKLQLAPPNIKQFLLKYSLRSSNSSSALNHVLISH